MSAAPLLNEGEIQKAIADLPGWEREGEHITGVYRFDAFMRLMRFIQAVAEAAEEADHHPDIDIRFQTAILRLRTHASGGLTRMDFDLAKRINRIAEAYR